MKKILLFLSVILCSCSLFAQKQISIDIWEDVAGLNESDNRLSSLICEYFKSELATHSGIKIIAPPAPQRLQNDVKTKIKQKRAVDFSKEKIVQLCDETNANIFCVFRLERKDKRFLGSVRIYTPDGTLKETISEAFDTIKDTDFYAIMLARKTAVAIRGDSPVDQINLAREKQLYENVFDQIDMKKVTDEGTLEANDKDINKLGTAVETLHNTKSEDPLSKPAVDKPVAPAATPATEPAPAAEPATNFDVEQRGDARLVPEKGETTK